MENLSYILNHPVARAALAAHDQACQFGEGNQAIEMLQQLRDLEYISLVNDSVFGLKPAGWKRVQELQHPGRDSKQAFVAMWFNDATMVAYDHGIRPAIEADRKTKALRIDRKEHNNRIDDEIVAEIRRSRYLVADFTGHRPGVYMEAGFALGLSIPVIWCISDQEKEEPHFDARQFNRIKYTSPENLLVKLTNRIRATIP